MKLLLTLLFLLLSGCAPIERKPEDIRERRMKVIKRLHQQWRQGVENE